MARFSIRSKLSLALILLALVPLVVSAVVLVVLNVKRLSVQAREFRLAVADSAIQRVNQLITESQTELSAVGSILLRNKLGLDAIEKLVKDYLNGAHLVHGVALYNREGKRVTGFRVREVVGQPPFPDRLPASLVQLGREKVLMPLTVQWSKQGKPFLPLALPVYQDKERKKLFVILWSAIDLSPLGQELSTVSYRRLDKNPNNVYLFDHKGRILAHPNKKRIGRPTPEAIRNSGINLNRDVGMTLEYTAKGVRHVAAVVPIPTLHWGLVVKQPKSNVYAAVRDTWVTAIAVGFGFGILALLIGLIMGRRLSSPVVDLARAARQVSTGNFDALVKVTSADEVGEMASAFNTMARDLKDYRKRVIEETRIRTDLSRYLSNEVVERVMDHTEELRLGGERRMVTVLFADVVLFTPLAEAHPPEDVVAILNEVFSFLTEIVFKHGGQIDKFIGDCVMAVFGGLESKPDDAIRAVRAAEEMLRWMEAANARWQKVFGRELDMGIGVNTGEVVAGNIGSSRRMEYTVIGDAVNVAARLEGLARPGQILLSARTRELVKDEFDTVSLGHHALSGRTESVEIFALEE